MLELQARLRTPNEPDGVEFPCNGRLIAAVPMVLKLITIAEALADEIARGS